MCTHSCSLPWSLKLMLIVISSLFPCYNLCLSHWVEGISLDIQHSWMVCCCYLVTKSCLTLWVPMDCSLPAFSVLEISQARILEWVAVLFSRGSSWPRDQTHISYIGRQILYHRATREALILVLETEIFRYSIGFVIYCKTKIIYLMA